MPYFYVDYQQFLDSKWGKTTGESAKASNVDKHIFMGKQFASLRLEGSLEIAFTAGSLA